MLNGVPTCFPNGLTNAQPGSLGARVPFPYPAQYYQWFDDFDRFDGAATGAHDWMLTAVGTSPVTVTDAVNGHLLITTGSAADGNGASAQYAGMNTIATVAEVVESFKFTTGKELWFATRFQISDATQSELMIGLAIADTTPIDATDGVFFYKNDDSTVLQLVSKIATPASASANLISTLVAATWYEIGFHYDGNGTITAYLLDSTTGTWNAVGSVSSAIPTTELAVTFGFWTGTTAAKTALIDYIFAAQERG